jgi:AcrR family transcriptional regulator
MNYSLLNIMFGLDYNEGIQADVQQPKGVKRSLRNKTAKVFGNGVSMSKIQKDDRRSKRTRQLIGDALVELMLEKSFADITVQDILDRANVGRSTFYAHYTDKDSLLSSEIARVIEDLKIGTANGGHAHGGILPSLELFRHIQKQRRMIHAFFGGHSMERLPRELQIQVSKIVENNLRSIVGEVTIFAVPLPLPLVAAFVVNTFLMLLHWWVENDLRQTPEQMDEIFQKLVMPSLHNLMKESERQG